MRLLPRNAKDALSLRRYDKIQKLFIFDGAVINPALVLTSGIFLSGFIVYLGGSDFIVGLLNNSLAWASVVALASCMLFERMRKRKALIITFQIFSRFLVCSTIFLPLIIEDKKIILPIITTMVILGNILWSFYGTGVNVWMMGAVPKHSRREFIYTRTFWLRITFTLFTIIMGYILDWFNKSYTGFFIVFTISLILSISDTFILLKIEEPENDVITKSRVSIGRIFEPWGNSTYRGYLLFIFLFYMGLFTSASFTPLYLIKYLEFDYKFISLINVISYIFMIISVNFWSKIEWKKGIEYVLKVGALFIIAEFLIYGFLTSKTYYFLYFSPILAGIGNGGFNIAVLNYRYDLMPESNKTIYEAWFGAVYGLGSIMAPILGGILLEYLPVIGNKVFQHGNFQLLYIMSFVFNIVLIYAFFGFRSAKERVLHSSNEKLSS